MTGEDRRDAMDVASAEGGYGHGQWPDLEVLTGDIQV